MCIDFIRRSLMLPLSNRLAIYDRISSGITVSAQQFHVCFLAYFCCSTNELKSHNLANLTKFAEQLILCLCQMYQMLAFNCFSTSLTKS